MSEKTKKQVVTSQYNISVCWPIFISNCRESNGWRLPTPKKILAAHICIHFPLAQLSCPPHPYASTPYNNTNSTTISKSPTNVAPFTSPTVALHLLGQSLSTFAPAFALSSTILTFDRYYTQPRYLYSSTTLIPLPPTWNLSSDLFTPFFLIYTSPSTSQH